MRKFLYAICCVVLAGTAAMAREFSVMAYNVENLFDADGVALYEDYHPDKYTPAMLATKIENIAKVLATVDGGKGPDIVAFNEIEVDQTPETTVTNYDEWLAAIAEKKAGDILRDDKLLTPELAGAPAEAWLLKACVDAGLGQYNIIFKEDGNFPMKTPSGKDIVVKNVIFSRFPPTNVRLHPTDSRPILEATFEIDGYPLTVFANHWKSGASEPAMEVSRIKEAKTLRTRLDEIFKDDPNADVIILGDLNSHYNQNRRYRQMRQTAINDILGSQGNVLALRTKDRDLYNLWFELPSDQRGSDIFRDEWGTLMHIILSRGLYDQNGVQYIDKSFRVCKIPRLNADVYGRPRRWLPSGSGFSDHFPLLARFRTVDTNDKTRWMPLASPSRTVNGPDEVLHSNTAVDLFHAALDISTLPDTANLRDGSYDGRICKVVDAPAHVDTGTGFVHVTVRGKEYDVFTFSRPLRAKIVEIVKETGKLSFYGEIGTYRGRWQFLLHGKEWLVENSDQKATESTDTLESAPQAGSEASTLTDPPDPPDTSDISKKTPPPAETPKYWLSKSGKRHNSSCRYYETGNGHPCTADEGTPCSICGG